jgi:ABC-2 type transport system ATP-binding protein
MIRVDNITRRYGTFTAVDRVSLAVKPGEVVGLLGHNGAGKTTILKMITGYLEPTAGTITIAGREIGQNRREIQRSIGYLPENCPVYPEMTVLGYLDYCASLHGLGTAERTPLIAEAIARTDLADKAGQTIATLSRGYRQRTGVAQAILHRPRLLILDEPTNGLDPTQILQMRALITDLAKTTTVIISTHILQEVQAICDRVVILKGGRKALDSRLDALQNEGRLLLRLDSGGEDAAPFLRQFPGVGEVTAHADSPDLPGSGYSLALPGIAASDRHQLAADLAAALHQRGWRLFAMHFAGRSLEAVFAEISAPGQEVRG